MSVAFSKAFDRPSFIPGNSYVFTVTATSSDGSSYAASFTVKCGGILSEGTSPGEEKVHIASISTNAQRFRIRIDGAVAVVSADEPLQMVWPAETNHILQVEDEYEVVDNSTRFRFENFTAHGDVKVIVENERQLNFTALAGASSISANCVEQKPLQRSSLTARCGLMPPRKLVPRWKAATAS